MLQRPIKKKILFCTVIRSASSIKKEGQVSGKYNTFLHGDNEHIGSAENLCLRCQPTGLQEIS